MKQCLLLNKRTQQCSCLKETKCDGCPFYKPIDDTFSAQELVGYYRRLMYQDRHYKKGDVENQINGLVALERVEL